MTVFRFIKALLRKIGGVFIPLKKPAPADKRQDKGKERADKPDTSQPKPSWAYAILVIGGVAMLLFGMIYGGVYGVFFLKGLHNERAELMQAVLEQSAMGRVQEAQKLYKEAEHLASWMKTFNSSYTHLSLFGLIALSMGASVSRTRLNEKLKMAAALALIFGGTVMAVGVFIQPLAGETFGKTVAIIGGTLVIGSTAVYLWGIIKWVLWGSPTGNV